MAPKKTPPAPKGAKKLVRATTAALRASADECKRGLRPVTRKIGKGCAACGKRDAW